ncbi:hypothetical protein BASA81_000932 [Batrachochytrium salamandrivorans]|nr:hypothetical protein BASA81_000932 [Batrachochytrium salamandrivorans]
MAELWQLLALGLVPVVLLFAIYRRCRTRSVGGTATVSPSEGGYTRDEDNPLAGQQLEMEQLEEGHQFVSKSEKSLFLDKPSNFRVTLPKGNPKHEVEDEIDQFLAPSKPSKRRAESSKLTPAAAAAAVEGALLDLNPPLATKPSEVPVSFGRAEEEELVFDEDEYEDIAPAVVEFTVKEHVPEVVATATAAAAAAADPVVEEEAPFEVEYEPAEKEEVQQVGEEPEVDQPIAAVVEEAAQDLIVTKEEEPAVAESEEEHTSTEPAEMEEQAVPVVEQEEEQAAPIAEQEEEAVPIAEQEEEQAVPIAEQEEEEQVAVEKGDSTTEQEEEHAAIEKEPKDEQLLDFADHFPTTNSTSLPDFSATEMFVPPASEGSDEAHLLDFTEQSPLIRNPPPNPRRPRRRRHRSK